MDSFLYFPTTNQYPFQYYVDSVGGSDSNDGLTPATAFQNVSAVQAIRNLGGIVPFTQINLKRGGTWSGAAAKLFLDVANLKITDYGSPSDPLPKIDSRVSLAAGSWSATGGTVNVFQYAFTGLTAQASQHNIWENGTRLVRTASTAACDALPGSYYVPAEASWSIGVPTNIYVHPTGSNSPITNGRTYTTQGVDWCIYIGSESSSSCRVYNVEVMGGCHHNGNIQLGRDSYAEGVVSRWGTIHSVYTDSGFFVNCYSYDCEQGYDFVANKGAASDGFIEMNGCLCELDDATSQIDGPGFFVHGDTMNTVRYINCISRDHKTGFGVAGAKGAILIQGCTVICSAADHVNVKAFDIGNDGYVPAATVTMTENYSDTYGYHIYGYQLNTVTTITLTGERVITRGTGIPFRNRRAAMTVQWCSCYAPSGNGYAGVEHETSGTVTVNRNIFHGYVLGVETWTTGFTGNHNVFYGASEWRLNGTHYASFAAYQTGASPQETNAASSDPLWVQTPSTAGNFNVQAGSPANSSSRDAGWSNRN